MPRPGPRTPWRRSNGRRHQSRHPGRASHTRPRAAPSAVGLARPRVRARRERPPARQRRPVGRQAELLRREGLRQPSGVPLAVPPEGSSRRHRRPTRLALVGGTGRHEALEGGRRRADRAVPRQPRRGRGLRRRRRLHPRRRDRDARRRLPRIPDRRRHPVLGGRPHGFEDPTAQAAGPRGDRGPAQELPLLQGQGCRGGLQERQPAAALRLREGQDPQPPHYRRVPPAPASGRGGGQAGPRDVAAAERPGVVMEVILTSDVEKLGLKGEVVDVKRGYARNYLLPRKLAEVATPGRVAEIRRIDEERARHEARSAEQAAGIADTLTKTVLRFEVKAGPTGALFGSVTPTDIAEELWRTRKIRVDRRKIDLDVIKRIGRFSIPVHVFEGVTAEVKTMVVPEGGELPPEEELAALEAAERAEAEAAEAAHAEALRETEAAMAAEDELLATAEDEADEGVDAGA